MRPPRVSILGLMLLVVGVSVGLVALRYSTPNVAGSVILLTLFGLGLTILAALYRRESRRAFWVGFALIGWGYLASAFGSWTLADDKNANGGVGGGKGPLAPPPVRVPWLVTTTLLDELRPSVQASHGPNIPSNQVPSFLGLTDSASRQIIAALNRPIRMPFVNETPLEDVLAHIKTNTKSASLPDGIPIYVDLIGLQEAEKTIASPISIDLTGVPLRTSLSLILRQLDLYYTVDDGLLTITSSGNTSEAVAVRVESFRRVGHCLFALMFGLIGGFAAGCCMRPEIEASAWGDDPTFRDRVGKVCGAVPTNAVAID